MPAASHPSSVGWMNFPRFHEEPGEVSLPVHLYRSAAPSVTIESYCLILSLATHTTRLTIAF